MIIIHFNTIIIIMVNKYNISVLKMYVCSTNVCNSFAKVIYWFKELDQYLD